MANLLGVDTSGWQKGIDFAPLPADLTIIKATGGTGFINQECDKQFQSARNAGTLTGLYHFIHETGYEGSAVQEADWFCDNTAGYWDGETTAWMDWEGDNTWDVQYAADFMARVKYRVGLLSHGMYTNSSTANAFDWTNVAKNTPLWIAQYAVETPTYNYYLWDGATLATQVTPPQSKYWKNGPIMWQFAANMRLPGWNGGLDANVFKGSKADWLQLGRLKNTPVSPPVTTDWWYTMTTADFIAALEDPRAKASIADSVLNSPLPWHAFNGNIPASGRNTTTLAIATGYQDTIAEGLRQRGDKTLTAVSSVNAAAIADAVATSINAVLPALIESAVQNAIANHPPVDPLAIGSASLLAIKDQFNK